MTALILHPVAATVVPRTIIETGRSGKPRQVRMHRALTSGDLRTMLAGRGIKHVAAHTKTELRAMHICGHYLRPAAYDRQNAARKAKRALVRAEKSAA